MIPFSKIEKQLVKAALDTKTDEQLAFILERPVEEVTEYINSITDGQAAERNKAVLVRQKEIVHLSKEKKKVIREILKEEATSKRNRKKQEEIKRRNREEALAVARQRRKEEGVVKSRNINFSELQSVRLDAKTHVLVKPGTDIEWIKKIYKRKPIGPGEEI